MPLPRLGHPTAAPQTLADIRAWHLGVLNALDDQRTAAVAAVQAGVPPAEHFVGMTEDEAEAYHRFQTQELDRLTVLNLVASAEAEVKVFFFRRMNRRAGKWKDTLSKFLRSWWVGLSARKQSQPNFDEDGILDRLKEAGVLPGHVLREFRECLKYRHWVAHGRWSVRPPSVDQLDPDDVFERATALIQALPV